MTPDGRDGEGGGLSRRSFVKYGGLLIGGAAASGLALGGAQSAYAAGGDGARRTTLRAGRAVEVGMSQARLEDVAARVQSRVTRGLVPGAAILVARHGRVVLERAFGVRQAGTQETMTVDTIFDLESMTKVLATAISFMILDERGQVRLTDRVATYLPRFATTGKGDVTIRDMLRYSSGLPIDNQFTGLPVGEIWRLMEETPLEYPTGTKVEYSDLTYRLLGRVLEAATGQNLDQFGRANVWSPLGMNDTTYNPPASLVSRIAATGPGSLGLRPGPLRGEVQDDQDWAVGGIVGCDGLFSTARDIAVFCQMILNGGSYGGARIVSGATVREMTRNQTPQVTEAETDLDPTSNLLFTPKGYGWELWTHRFSSGGMRLSPGSFGKAGGAGTFMWLDRRRDLFGIILTNHGLPIPFDEPGWNDMLDAIGVYQFFDGVVNAVTSEAD